MSRPCCPACPRIWGIPIPGIRTGILSSTEAKRKALEAVYGVVTADLAEWNQDPELLSWLASL